MSPARLLTTLPHEIQHALTQRRAWLLSEPKQAFYWLLELLRARPLDPTLNQHMATVTQRLGERSVARGFLSQAMQLSLASPELQYSYLELLIQEGRVERALSTGLRWLRRSPDDRALLVMVGYTAEKRWGHEASLPYYERAFRLGERATFSHFLLMRAIYEVRGATEAAPLVSRHLNTYPQDPDARAWLLCAQVTRELQRIREGEPLRAQLLEAYQRALSCDHDNQQAHAGLAHCYERHDDERAYTHALRARGPEADLELYLLLCRLELRRGDLDAARYALLLSERQAGSSDHEELMALKAQLGLSDGS